MKCNISGPRDIDNDTALEIITQAIKDSGFKITKLMSTCESGVDTWARNWASENDVPVVGFQADWSNIKGVPKENIKKNSWGKKYNTQAAKLRDDMMMGECDAAIIIDDGGYSKKYLAEQHGVEVHVHKLVDNTEYEYQF